MTFTVTVTRDLVPSATSDLVLPNFDPVTEAGFTVDPALGPGPMPMDHEWATSPFAAAVLVGSTPAPQGRSFTIGITCHASNPTLIMAGFAALVVAFRQSVYELHYVPDVDDMPVAAELAWELGPASYTPGGPGVSGTGDFDDMALPNGIQSLTFVAPIRRTLAGSL